MIPMSPFRGDMSFPGLPFSPQLGLLPPMMPSYMSHMDNQTSMNLTALYATVRNMTAVEIVTSLQSIVVASVMRQCMFNDIFAGGVGLMLVTIVGTQLNRIWSRFVTWLTTTKGPVQIRISRDSEAYQWMQSWLRQFALTSSSHYDVNCTWEEDYDSNEAGKQRPKISFLPEFKTAQKIMYKNDSLWVQSSKELQSSGGGGEDNLLNLLKGAGAKDDLIISALNKKLLEDAVNEAMEAYFKKEDESRTTGVYRWSCEEMYWVSIGSRKIRPIESVILDCDPSPLLEDARRFLSSEAWYADRGIPHRRGYLLHGPPGSGKTSLIKALAGELKLDVSLISLSSKDLSDDILQSAMNRLPCKSVFVLEDVDAAFRKEPDVPLGNSSDDGMARLGTTKNNLSFSGLLNAIDGITAQEGNIVIMTTNHIDRLDPALIRPGRIDVRLYLGLASAAQACGIFRRFFPDSSPEDEEKVAAAVPPGVVSPASLQGLFLEHRDDLEGMLASLGPFVAQAKSESGAKAGAVPVEMSSGEASSGEAAEDGGEELEKQAGGRRKKEKRNKKSKDKRKETTQLLNEQEETAGDSASQLGSASSAEAEMQQPAPLSSAQENEEGWEKVTKGAKNGTK